MAAYWLSRCKVNDPVEYKKYTDLVPGIIAGYWANWGLDNRISTYRIPGERGAATRIENRMPCGTANPYLAAAVMLNAALLGVVDGLDCGDPQVGDGEIGRAHV